MTSHQRRGGGHVSNPCCCHCAQPPPFPHTPLPYSLLLDAPFLHQLLSPHTQTNPLLSSSLFFSTRHSLTPPLLCYSNTALLTYPLLPRAPSPPRPPPPPALSSHLQGAVACALQHPAGGRES
eukprot:365381-Chlamydomonas_euryale.AAC.15